MNEDEAKQASARPSNNIENEEKHGLRVADVLPDFMEVLVEAAAAAVGFHRGGPQNLSSFHQHEPALLLWTWRRKKLQSQSELSDL